jgi:8-oxo-dGTP diphosphatase
MDPHFIGKVNVKALIEQDGKILIVRGHDDKESWDFPGGRMHDDESAEDALVREVHEELGVKINRGPLLLTEQVKHISDPARHLFMTYRATLADPAEPLHIPSEELAEMRWVDKVSIKDYDLYKNCAGPLEKYWPAR